MSWQPPESLALARVPTPIERVERWPLADSGVALWVKRDDLTGADTSGNKLRKLQFSFAEARRRGADAVVTCGGWASNHCRATALVAARLGMRCVLLLRTEDGGPGETDGNLLLSRIAGADVRWTDRAGYLDRDARMAAIAEELAAGGATPYVIPEGASNAIGAMGYAAAALEIAEQAAELGLRFDAIVHPCGSGGTTAGLAIGCAVAGERLPGRLIAFGTNDDRAHLEARVDSIVAEAAAELGAPAEVEVAIDDLCAAGGLTDERIDLACAMARQSGLLFDPTYGVKAFDGLCRYASDGRLSGDVLYVHTGGVFGWYPHRSRVAARLEASR